MDSLLFSTVSEVCFHIVNYGAIVYRLGHLVFIQASGVRFPVALPSFYRRVAAKRILKRPVELAGVLILSRLHFDV